MMKPYAKTLTILVCIVFAAALLIAILSFFKIVPILRGESPKSESLSRHLLVVVDQIAGDPISIRNVYTVYFEQTDQITIITEHQTDAAALTSIIADEYRSTSVMLRKIKKSGGFNEFHSFIVVDSVFVDSLDTLYEKYKKHAIEPDTFDFCEILSLMSDEDWQKLMFMSPEHLQSDSMENLADMQQLAREANRCYFELNRP